MTGSITVVRPETRSEPTTTQELGSGHETAWTCNWTLGFPSKGTSGDGAMAHRSPASFYITIRQQGPGAWPTAKHDPVEEQERLARSSA